MPRVSPTQDPTTATIAPVVGSQSVGSNYMSYKSAMDLFNKIGIAPGGRHPLAAIEQTSAAAGRSYNLSDLNQNALEYLGAPKGATSFSVKRLGDMFKLNFFVPGQKAQSGTFGFNEAAAKRRQSILGSLDLSQPSEGRQSILGS